MMLAALRGVVATYGTGMAAVGSSRLSRADDARRRGAVATTRSRHQMVTGGREYPGYGLRAFSGGLGPGRGADIR